MSVPGAARPRRGVAVGRRTRKEGLNAPLASSATVEAILEVQARAKEYATRRRELDDVAKLVAAGPGHQILIPGCILVVEEVEDIGEQFQVKVGGPDVVQKPDVDDPERRVPECANRRRREPPSGNPRELELLTAQNANRQVPIECPERLAGIRPRVPAPVPTNLEAVVPAVRRADLEQVRDQAGLVAGLLRRARVEPDDVALEVGVEVGVGVPGRIAERIGRECLPVVPLSLPERKLQALVVALAACQRRDDEVRVGECRVPEVVEAQEE